MFQIVYISIVSSLISRAVLMPGVRSCNVNSDEKEGRGNSGLNCGVCMYMYECDSAV